MNQDVYNIALFNEQALDIWSDIIVSFEYERISYNSSSTGGFALVFFDSISDAPRGGGPGSSLGYAPSNEQDYCQLGGFPGLQAAFLGIGFDNKGLFAAGINGRTGIPLTEINNAQTLTVRDGVANNYNVLKSINLVKVLSSFSNASTFTVDQSAAIGASPLQRSVRVILKNHGTILLVQLKDSPDRNQFDTVLELSLPERQRKSLRVALTNTADNNLTNFKVKNFNVAGFPGVLTKQKIEGCSSVLSQFNYGLVENRRICTGEEFIVTSLPNQVVTYTTDTVKYSLKNIIYTGSGIQVTGSAGNDICVIYEKQPLVGLYKFLGEKLSKNFFINTPDEEISKWVDIDKTNSNVAIFTRAVSGAVHIYNYITQSESPEEIGTWKLYQTINYDPIIHNNKGFLNKVKINGNNLAINADYETVHMYRKNIFNIWEYIQTLSATIAPNLITGFGEEMAISDDNLLVGAPQSQKANIPEPVQGEVYHYIYDKAQNKWNLVMALGSFYNLNTPLGTFGSSIDFQNNICVVGSPGEEYRFTQDDSVINVGRVHVFRKTPGGLFSQGVAIAPEGKYIEKNAFFGSSVSLADNHLFVLSPFTLAESTSNITTYDLSCTFATPPPQINVPACALITFDNRSFILDTITGTYMLSYVCQQGAQ